MDIVDLEVEGLYPDMIGDPVHYAEAHEISESANNFFDADKFKSKHAKAKPIQVFDTDKKKPPIVLEL
jgi:hypothetical protein